MSFHPRRAWSRLRFVIRYGLGATVARVWVLLSSTHWVKGAYFIGKPPKIEAPGRLQVGTGFVTRGHLVAPSLTTGPDGELVIGDDVFVNDGTRIHASESVRIGGRTEIADFVVIFDTNFHAVGPGEPIVVEPIEIGPDSWIANGAMLLPGVRLGRGCVVAAGAIVLRGDYDDGSVLAGNPARVVKKVEIPPDYRRRGRRLET